MKRFIKTVLILLMIIRDSEMTNAQVSTGFNFGRLVDYVGWDGTTTIPLDIRHNNTANPQNIDFYTDSTFQMTILGNNVYNNGFVGVGLSLPRLKLEVNNNIGVISLPL